MDQGRGSSFPGDKGVKKSGDIWIPSTPDKPVVQSSNNDQSEMQQNQMVGEDWYNLIGMYKDVLRNKQPLDFDLNSSESLNCSEHNYKGVPLAENYCRLEQNLAPSGIVGLNSKVQLSQDVAPVETYSGLPLNFDQNGFTGMNDLEHGIQNASILHKSSLNQNAGREGSYAQNFGEVVSSRKVDSFAQLMSIMIARRSSLSDGSPERSTFFAAKPTITHPISHVESNQVAHASVGERVQQNHIFHGSNQVAYARVGAGFPQSHVFYENHDVGRYNQQEIPNSEYNACKTSGERVQQNHIFHESNPVANARVGAGFPQSHVFYESHDDGRYNQQEIPNSRLSVAEYNLNLTPRSESRESSSASRSSLLGPVTPDQQNQSKMHQIYQVPHFFIDDTSTTKKYMHGSGFSPSESGILEKEQSVTLANSVSTSTAGISVTPQDMRCSDGGNGGIDLNKTPLPKTPKRVKHRPKVVVEGKPKRSPKNSSTKRNTPGGTPPAKKQHVRKDGTKNSTPPMTDTLKVVEASDVGAVMKSCKRKLNFDLETGAENGAEKEGQVRRPRQPDHLEQNNECHKVSLDSSGPSTCVAGAGHHNTYDKERRQTSSAYNLVHSLKNIPLESLPVETTELLPASRDHSLNAIARSFNARTSSVIQSGGEIRYNQVHHCSGGHPHIIFQAIPCEQNLGFGGHSSVQTTPQVLENLMDTTDKQGIKRAYKHTVIRSSKDIALMGPQVQFHEVTKWKTGSEMCKKNTENKSQGTSFSMNSGLTTIKEGIRENESRRNKSILAQSSTEHQNGESRDSVSRRHMINAYPNDNSAKFVCDPYMNNTNVRHKFQQQYASSQLHESSDTILPKTSHYSVDTQITKSVTAVVDRIMESVSSRDPLPIPINGYVYSPLHVEVNKKTAGLETYKKATVVDKVLQQEPKNKRSYKNSSKKSAGNRVEKRNILSVDDITDGMKDLQITNSSKQLIWKEQSALVPYIRDGAVVPYEEFDVKKKIPRPRVDLDPETNRMWNLLMGDEGGDSAETMDTNREKWWEEERKVFRGRVDSFIARMHLVQGDRRFSKWKGSVVDSVIGVFLTQNVSDHLSSSAFMSLAAKFPSKSTMAGVGNGGNPPVGNHDVRITYPDGTTFHQKMVLELVNDHSSVTSTEKAQPRKDNVLPEKKTSLMNNYSRRTDGDIISSQSSSESFVLHASEDVRSSSGSNSEVECGWNISKNVGQVSVSQQTKRIAALQQNELRMKGSSCPNKTNLIDHQQFDTSAYGQCSEWVGISKLPHHQISVPPFNDSWPSMSMGLLNWQEDGLGFLGSQSISTLTSKDSKGTGAQCMDDYRGQSAESAFMVSDDGRSKFQTSSINDAVLKGDLELQNDSVNESYNCNSEHSIKHMSEKHGAFHREDSLLKDTRRPSDAFSKQPTELSDDRKPTETTSNTRKRKAAKEKAESFNWDTLRKQVLLNAGTTERSREAMDSLDYEALQNADVHEISDTIKERGMSNVLAERMKNFLNRLVEDHERIDLEWLRDVEPDKSKDYLLSIRGLGLKSVECVRLLTLHHLAFPVDTNVGRIAVRLGWVPLQPLPESLQLHLLELYPILESIQKYLWPRLCKLDQETLYELHYQMITFGKVFCTKRDPNCNACPMRAECRHFASAFASARLALPGLQERHIVRSSPASVYANNSSDVIIKPMPLLPSEDTIEQGVRLSGDCEPVIEEPKTPDPPTELEERDIEDAFYEDPDEIPVIKLNIEEFTTNLQSLLEKQIEIGGDMSKALVALSPGLASIPTPKLKHASRLRTEHQVYELPDWHPLIKEMDRREPDDPSPYLLAIWTPGETADSIQAPESRCRSMEGGGMCGNETCFSCNSTREAQAQTVRGTILIPCRTAMRGSFPLNGTYFQVNEVFADHESSLNPIYVPRNYLWNLPRRTVFFGSSVSSIFKGLSTKDIQFCFWKGFVCVRGFDQKTRAPRPLKARLHFPASKMAKRNEEI